MSDPTPTPTPTPTAVAAPSKQKRVQLQANSLLRRRYPEVQVVWLVLSKTQRARIWRPTVATLKRSEAKRVFDKRVTNFPNLHHAIRRVELLP